LSNPPVPTQLKLLRGNPGKRAIRPEPEPPRLQEPPPAPRILRGDALVEWHRVTRELMLLGLLTTLDLHPLAAYCQAFGRWMAAEEILARYADGDPVTQGMMVKGSLGNPIQNPLVKIADRASDNMVRYAAEFGFTPVARTRIASGRTGRAEDRPPSKFAGLLAG
jgi:P27 family predicted phage terminase small subunit